MFAGPVSMNERCPQCGHHFMREPGFFQGAMYVSYTLATFQLVILVVLSQLFVAPRAGQLAAWVVALGVHAALVLRLFRTSRAIWAHLNVLTRAPDADAPIPRR